MSAVCRFITSSFLKSWCKTSKKPGEIRVKYRGRRGLDRIDYTTLYKNSVMVAVVIAMNIKRLKGASDRRIRFIITSWLFGVPFTLELKPLLDAAKCCPDTQSKLTETIDPVFIKLAVALFMSIMRYSLPRQSLITM